MPSMTLPPTPLHLPRLAAATPDQWVTLPESESPLRQRVLWLTQKCAGERAGVGGEWLLCLSGQVVLDLPAGQWAQLGAGESLRIGAGTVWDAVPASGKVVLLRIAVDG